MGGILDTWVTIFQSDTKSVEEGNKKGEQSADNLIAKLKNTDEAAKHVGETFSDTLREAAFALTAFFAAKTTLDGIVETADMIVELDQTSQALGETIENVDAFGKAAQAMGGEADSARDSLVDLSEKMGEAADDAESAAAKSFKELGIGLKNADGSAKTAVAGILDIASAVEKLPKTEAIFKVKELGITDNKTVEMILKGRTELERLINKQKEYGTITKQNVEDAKKFKEAWGGLAAGFERAGYSIATTLMPYFTKMLDILGVGFDWLEEHKNVVIGFFIAVGTAVAVFYVPSMLAAAAATLAATWPILAIGAAIAVAAAAFALIYDDIMAFIDGNDSFIGQMVEKYPIVGDLIEDVADAFIMLGNVGKVVWETLSTGFKQMVEFITEGIKQIAAGISTVAKFFGIGEDEEPAPTNKPALPSGSGQAASDVPMVEPTMNERQRQAQYGGNGKAATDVPTLDSPQAPKMAGVDPDVPMVPAASGRGAFPAANMQTGQQQLSAAANSPLNSTTSNAIANTANNTKVENSLSVGEINVNAPQATDADGVAKGISNGLDEQLKAMQEGSANGRAR